MGYDDLIDAVAERVDGLPPQRRAAVFWLAGSGLLAGLSDSESAGWTGWFDEASDLSVDFIVDGRAGDNVREVWEQASASTGPDASQLLHSVIVCLSSPLAIAMEPEKSVGSWIEHALFPVIQKVSLDLFDDIAFPDDDGLEQVLADDRFRAAGDYCMSVCARLEGGLGWIERCWTSCSKGPAYSAASAERVRNPGSRSRSTRSMSAQVVESLVVGFSAVQRLQ
ncbi:hypothetical protein E0H73_39605 [Kribbella pittospori]|uniref:Uncharacterized protein n=1 Tax=Kribbella pittospori TaxID=722689 RepID=A0A4R0K8M3_9ACTN|nr:hypothetical protein [Kribbella pittospori]TCC54258.1 hypothetical protein E0H73_39605 [Kribbella pittospori]